jgi:3-oxoacyl-[acyl-carrier-protein] synthase II
LFDGTSRGNFGYWYERIREEQRHTLRQIYGQNELVVGCPGQAVNLAAALLHVHGPVYTFNGTCSAGAIAIGHALRELESGRIDVAFGTGHDCPLLPPIFQMYKACELLAFGAGDPKTTVRPYAGHSRNVFAEGAVTLVLERADHARRRGARVIATLAAYEYGNYGTHPTDVDGTGKRPARVIDHALAAAGAAAEEIRFVVGHGNAAPRSDRSELEYMRLVFGPRTSEVPLISVKPIYGHLMGGSSALSTAAAALMVQNQYIVPTLNIDRRRAAPGFNHQAGTGKEDPCGTGLVVNLGLGGQTTALVVRRFEGASA